jgi:hypothetical protein
VKHDFLCDGSVDIRIPCFLNLRKSIKPRKHCKRQNNTLNHQVHHPANYNILCMLCFFRLANLVFYVITQLVSHYDSSKQVVNDNENYSRFEEKVVEVLDLDAYEFGGCWVSKFNAKIC